MSNLSNLLAQAEQSEYTFAENIIKKFVEDMAISFIQSDQDLDDAPSEKSYEHNINNHEEYTDDLLEFTFSNNNSIADMLIVCEANVRAKHIFGEGGSDNSRSIEVKEIQVTKVVFYILDNEFDLSENVNVLNAITKELEQY